MSNRQDKETKVIGIAEKLAQNSEPNGKKTARILLGKVDERVQVKIAWLDKKIAELQDEIAMYQEHRNLLWQNVQNEFGLKVDSSTKFELQLDGQLVEIKEIDIDG